MNTLRFHVLQHIMSSKFNVVLVKFSLYTCIYSPYSPVHEYRVYIQLLTLFVSLLYEKVFYICKQKKVPRTSHPLKHSLCTKGICYSWAEERTMAQCYSYGETHLECTTTSERYEVR